MCFFLVHPPALARSLPLPNVLRNWWERCKSEPNGVRCLIGWVLCSVLSGCCSKHLGPGRDAASTCRTTAFSVHAFRNSCDVILSSPTERRIGHHGFGAFLLRMGGQFFFPRHRPFQHSIQSQTISAQRSRDNILDRRGVTAAVEEGKQKNPKLQDERYARMDVW